MKQAKILNQMKGIAATMMKFLGDVIEGRVKIDVA